MSVSLSCTPKRREQGALSRNGRAVCTKAVTLGERAFGVVQPTETHQRPRATQHGIPKLRANRQDRIVLAQGFGRIVFGEGDGRESNPVLQRTWVGR